jgi:hypothetical protein
MDGPNGYISPAYNGATATAAREASLAIQCKEVAQFRIGSRKLIDNA